MEKQKENKEETKERRYISNSHSAAERCQAVLAVWTERRKPAEICREMQLKWVTLQHWQNRALEGMLHALEPRTTLEQGPALSPRLQAMLEKRQERALHRPGTVEKRLEKRLQALTGAKAEKKEPVTAKP